MASALKTLASRIEKLEEQGFIIPHYFKQITREKTAKKYTMTDIAYKSRYLEHYFVRKEVEEDGKKFTILEPSTRIVSGERGMELIRSERARKGLETRRKNEQERIKRETVEQSDLFESIPVGTGEESPFRSTSKYDEEGMLSLYDSVIALDSIIRSYFDRFKNQELASAFLYVYEANSDKEFIDYNGRKIDAFILGLTNIKSDVIEELQKAMMIEYWEKDEAQKSYTEWLNLMSKGQPTLEQRKMLADMEDRQ